MNSSIRNHYHSYLQLSRYFEYPQHLALLLARCYVAWVFFASGLTKLNDWETTLFLFEYEYQVPFLSPAVAAFLGTAGEIILPVLLAFGISTRFAALGLSVVNIVAVISLEEIAPAAFAGHVIWGLLLGLNVLWGSGILAIDTLIAKYFAKNNNEL